MIFALGYLYTPQRRKYANDNYWLSDEWSLNQCSNSVLCARFWGREARILEVWRAKLLDLLASQSIYSFVTQIVCQARGSILTEQPT